MHSDKLNPKDNISISLTRGVGFRDICQAKGQFWWECMRPDGTLRWREHYSNVVATVGKNQLLEAGLNGSAYTVTGPYVGLISGNSFSAVSASDTMSSHSGWLEAGAANAPQYSGTRKTVVWAAASGGAMAFNAVISFSITGDGPVEGLFIVFGSGASATIGDTNGVLFSAGVASGGERQAYSGDILNSNYSISL